MHDVSSQNDAAGRFMLEVDRIQVFYGTCQAVKNVSFTVHAGEIFGLLGPNGAGKTSTMSVIEGSIRPTSGFVAIAGINMIEDPLAARQMIGVHLQKPAFHLDLSLLQIVELFAGLHGMSLSRREKDQLFSDIGLFAESRRPYRQLSGGQQQRFSLAVASIHGPRLLLLDEPTVGLDPQSRRQLWDRIRAHKGMHRSVILTTHSMEEASSVCDRIAIIDHGMIIAVDAPVGLVLQYRNDPRVLSIAHGEVTLEDVFIGLTGREIRS